MKVSTLITLLKKCPKNARVVTEVGDGQDLKTDDIFEVQVLHDLVSGDRWVCIHADSRPLEDET